LLGVARCGAAESSGLLSRQCRLTVLIPGIDSVDTGRPEIVTPISDSIPLWGTVGRAEGCGHRPQSTDSSLAPCTEAQTLHRLTHNPVASVTSPLVLVTDSVLSLNHLLSQVIVATRTVSVRTWSR
jgi:hypothetical protein